MTRPYVFLLLVAMVLVGSVSGAAVVVNPGAGYFVIHNANQNHHYEPSGYTAPKEVSDNLVVFVLACLVVGPLSLVGIACTQGIPALQAIIVIIALLIIVGYIFPTYHLMTNAMMKERCIPNTVWNTSCGGN